MRSHRNLYWLWLVPVLLIAAGLSIRMLNIDLLWGDEVLSYDHANLAPYSQVSLGDQLERLYVRYPTQSPTYFVILKIWGGLVGTEPLAIRSLSVFLGMIAIAMTYRLGTAAVNRRVGLYAATILAGSTLMIYYMHEARQYALLLALSTTITWAYWRVQHSPRRGRWPWLILFVASMLLAYTHWLALLVPFAIGLYHLTLPKTRRWWQILLTLIAANATLIPWALLELPNIMNELGDGRDAIAFSAVDIPGTVFYAFSNGGLALLLLLTVLAIIDRRRHQDALRFSLMAIIGTLIAAIGINTVTPAFIHVRYFMMLWPILALLSALGITTLARRRISAAVLLISWLAAGAVVSWTLDFAADLPNTQRPIIAGELPEIIRVIKAEATPEDLIVFHLTEPGNEQSQRAPLEFQFQWTDMHVIQLGELGSVFEDDYRTEVDDLVEDAPLVWLAQRTDIEQVTDLPIFTDEISQNYLLCDLWQPEERLDVRVWANKATPTNATYTFGEQSLDMRVHRARRYDPSIASVILDLDAAYPISYTAVALHIYDSSDQLVRQADIVMSNGCDRLQIDFAGLGAGDYRLDLIVYDTVTGLRFTPTNTDFTLQSDNRMTLLTMTLFN
ncbi:MAG: glycosyltransferase family 39 protein [Anaerolineae bacterium]|nr:glycosyltransferase family 39 protein [Anaerolineae bacterium]